ncbi:hypothetical protein ABIA16_004594 [Sinorhizobium fredii]
MSVQISTIAEKLSFNLVNENETLNSRGRIRWRHA